MEVYGIPEKRGENLKDVITSVADMKQEIYEARFKLRDSDFLVFFLVKVLRTRIFFYIASPQSSRIHRPSLSHHSPGGA